MLFQSAMFKAASPLARRSARGICWVWLLLAGLGQAGAQEVAPVPGDLDDDGFVTVLDLVKVISEARQPRSLSTIQAARADVNEDGVVDDRDADLLISAILGFPIPQAKTPVAFEPAAGAGEVGVTVRPKATFPKAVNVATLNSNNFYATQGGRRLAATIRPSDSGSFAWLFFDEPMPNAATIEVVVDGNSLRTLRDLPLDADGDGVPGGLARVRFSTVSVTPLEGTVLQGRVVDPGPDLIPRTRDDVVLANGYQYLRPIAGVKVFLHGLEDRAVFTDTNGWYRFEAVPVGNVKVVTDGRTATTAHEGFFWPEMVSNAHMEPGITNYLMYIRDTNGVITPGPNGFPMPVPVLYLPRVMSNVLQTVSTTNVTIVTLATNAAYDLPPEQQQHLTLEVPPGSMIGENGQLLATGTVGISVVPPDLVREMLPPGLLQHTFDISIQAPGIAAFSRPVPMTFPNVFNAPPGTKLHLLSFDHTTGRLVIEGTATVSEDGLSVRTDPGTGITHPGWHGLTPPGDPPPPPDPPPCNAGPGICCASYGLTSGDSYDACINSFVGGDGPSVEGGRAVGFDESRFGVGPVGDARRELHRELIAFYNLVEQEGALRRVMSNLVAQAGSPTNLPPDKLLEFQTAAGSLNTLHQGLPAREFYAPRVMHLRVLENQLATLRNEPPHVFERPFFYAFEDMETGEIVRGSALVSSDLTRAFLRPEAPFRLLRCFPKEGAVFEDRFQTPPSGQRYSLCYAPFDSGFLNDTTDTDGDGLGDIAEFVLGTDPNQTDTDHDDASDGAEVQQGLDPLTMRPAVTGVIAALPLPGDARDLVVQEQADGRRVAFVASGSAGLVLVDVTDAQRPLRLSELLLPGDAVDVAVDASPTLNLALVAAQSGGLHFVSIADPGQPSLVRSLNVAARQVEMIAGIAYVTVGAQVWAFDTATGELREQLNLSGGLLTGLACEGTFLYAMDASRSLHVIEITEGTMTRRSSLALPHGGGALFAGGGLVLAAGPEAGGAGFATISVTNPAAPVLLSGADSAAIQGSHIVPNGSGLALAVGGLPAPTSGLDVLDLSDPADTRAFLTHYTLPGIPRRVAVAGGVAFVACGPAGLQVVNYRAFDVRAVPPLITLLSDLALTSPTTAVAQAGQLIRLQARTTDDVQVRGVEFFVEADRVATDLSFPFEHRFPAPALTPLASQFVLRARAFDTGGNAAWSNPLLVELLPDTSGPVTRRMFPADGAILGAVDLVAVFFNEPIDPATISTANFQLWPAGTNVLPVLTLPLTNGQVSYRSSMNGVFLTFPEPLPAGLYEARLASPLADTSRNRLARDVSWRFRLLGRSDRDFDGVPDDVELDLGTDPDNADSNANGTLDGDEDPDQDNLVTRWELAFDLDPARNDTDDNGVRDGLEDPDRDSFSIQREAAAGTHPLNPDSDGDGWNDETEVTGRSNPLDAASTPRLFVVGDPPAALAIPTSLSPAGLGALAFGTVVANPPAALAIPIIPATDPTVALSFGSVLASPPAALAIPVIPLDTQRVPLTFGSVVANPPAALVVPVASAPGLLHYTNFGSLIAMPPVLIIQTNTP